MLLTAIGVLGYALRRIDAPIAPVMIGLILGPVGDQQLRRALAISDGDWSVFVTRPLSLTLLAIAVGLAVFGAGRSSVATKGVPDPPATGSG